MKERTLVTELLTTTGEQNYAGSYARPGNIPERDLTLLSYLYKQTL